MVRETRAVRLFPAGLLGIGDTLRESRNPGHGSVPRRPPAHPEDTQLVGTGFQAPALALCGKLVVYLRWR